MELYGFGKGHRPSYIFRALIFWVAYEFALSAPRNLNRITDECDWFGSGLETGEIANLGVRPVYLRCKEGSIEWHYPRGALRIVLRMGHSNKEFQACLKVGSHSSGATLYLEGHQKLQYLYGYDEEGKSENELKCFLSSGGQVAIFLEAQGPSDFLKKAVFRFMYDLQPIKEKSYTECRPCTERELLFLFCTSDFAVRGFISSLYEDERMQRTELMIKSTEIFRDSYPKAFTNFSKTNNNQTVYSGVLHRPLHCGTKIGSGEFLFLGRWRLGSPVLMCAPRWNEWKRVRRKAILSDNLDCILE